MLRRLRTFILITGMTLCVLIAAAFVASARWAITFQFPTSRGPAMYLMSGSAILASGEMMPVALSADTHSFGLSRWNSWAWQRLLFLTTGGAIRFYQIPLYAFGPKPVKPGHCRCGYDLRGNASGVCPECGIEVQA